MKNSLKDSIKGKILAITLILIISTNAFASDTVTMYFFWGTGCPHCTEMKPFIQKLGDKYPDLEIKSLEVFKNKENMAFMDNLSEAYNTTIGGVPDVFIGDQIVRGYGGSATEKRIEGLIINCTRDGCKSPDEILQEYRSRPKTTTTTSTTTTSTTTTTEPTTTTTTTTTSTTTTTEPTTTSTTTTTTTSTTTTTAVKPENATIKPWVYGPIGITLILLIYGINKNKKNKQKEKK